MSEAKHNILEDTVLDIVRLEVLRYQQKGLHPENARELALAWHAFHLRMRIHDRVTLGAPHTALVELLNRLEQRSRHSPPTVAVCDRIREALPKPLRVV